MQPSSFNHLSKRQHYTSDSGYFSYFEGNRQTKRNDMASGDYERLPMYVSSFSKLLKLSAHIASIFRTSPLLGIKIPGRRVTKYGTKHGRADDFYSSHELFMPS